MQHLTGESLQGSQLKARLLLNNRNGKHPDNVLALLLNFGMYELCNAARHGGFVLDRYQAVRRLKDHVSKAALACPNSAKVWIDLCKASRQNREEPSGAVLEALD